MRKITKEDLYKMDAVEIYKLVLDGNYLTRFPHGFWQQGDYLENSIKCTKYLIEEKLKLNDEQIKELVCQEFFKKYKLKGMVNRCFSNSPYNAINHIYPERFFEWEFKQVPNGYWNKETGIKAIKWLIETKLKLNDEQIKEQLSIKFFKDNGFGGMLTTCFNNSPYQAISETYPNRFFEWELRCTPMGYWKDKSNSIKATKWLIETKLKLNDEQLKEQLSTKLFKDNGLGGMLEICFGGSPYQAINETYPNRFVEFDFNSTPNKYWNNKENAIKSIKYLIEKKLKLTDEELKEQLSYKFFKDNGLGGMLNHCFDNSPFKAIDETYPNKFKKEDFKNYR